LWVRIVIRTRRPLAGARENGAVAQAANFFPDIPLTLDFQNRAEEKFGRKLFDCEPNGVRRPREASVAKSLVRRFAKPRREQLRLGVVVEGGHGSLRCGLLA
jgi:hypothetical protein